jgi:hypothetical protein
VGRNRVNTVPRELPVLSALNDNRGWNSPDILTSAWR